MRRGTLFVLLSAFFWGTTFPAARYGLLEGEIGPYAFLYYRFALATLALLAFAAWKRRIDFHMFADPRILLLAAVTALGYVLQYVALDRTTASKAALLVNVNVLATAVLAWLLLRERISRGTGWGVALGLAGVYLVTTGGDTSVLRFSNREFVGDLLAFGTGLCWTVYILVAKRLLDQRPGLDIVALTVVVFVVTTVLLFPLAALTDGLAYTGNARAAWTIVYLGIFPTTLAFLLYQEGLRSTSAAVSSVLLLFEIVVAIAIGYAFLSERLDGAKTVGALLILGATYLASQSPRPTRRTAVEEGSAPGQA